MLLNNIEKKQIILFKKTRNGDNQVIRIFNKLGNGNTYSQLNINSISDFTHKIKNTALHVDFHVHYVPVEYMITIYNHLLIFHVIGNQITI